MLKKLSLAALVAMGSMSVASANTDLSEAIKGTTIGGYLRYRYTEDNTKNHSATGDNANSTTSEYKAVLKTSVKVSDEVSINSKLVGKITNSTTNSNGTALDAGQTLKIKEAYIAYSANGAAVKAGQQFLVTPLSDHDDDLGNGVLATYSLPSVTLAGAYMNSVNTSGTAVSNNLVVAAAIANIEMVKAQAWFYDLLDSGSKDGKTSYFVEAAANVGPVAVKAQYAQGKAHADGSDTNKFAALAVVGKADVVNVTAAYLKFGSNGSDVRPGTAANADALITAGDILDDSIQQGSFKDGDAVALVLNTNVGKYTPGVQYVHASINGSKDVANEYDLDLAYKYTKKLTFSGYYAFLKENGETVGNINKTEGRIEAKYSF
jgi:preprotein translocase subunit YajC